MAKLKTDVGALLDRAVNSITLAVELFNRPSEVERQHAQRPQGFHTHDLHVEASAW